MSDGARILIFATFANEKMADYVNTSVRDNAEENGVKIDALALIAKDREGKIHTREKGDLSAKEGAIRGGIAGAIFGLIFPPSLIASAIVGATIGGVASELRDAGFPTDELKKIGEKMQNGEFAVLFLGPLAGREFVHRYLANATTISEQVLPGSLADVIDA